MASITGLTIIKQFPYRGDATEEYSNQYWLTGAPPDNDADWMTLLGAVVTNERECYHSEVTVARAYGYNDDAEDATAVWSHDYKALAVNVPGTLTGMNSFVCPGDDAAWVRWRTSRLNTKGKAIYLRKYFHPAYNAGSTTALCDTLHANYKAALDGFGFIMSNGSLPGGRSLRSRTHVETITGYSSSIYVTTRTLKRRGKRPNS